MRIVLKYTRLAKPRGGWFFPLWFRIGPEWEEGEAQALVPAWSYKQVGATFGDLRFFNRAHYRAGGWQCEAAYELRSLLERADYNAAETAWYFPRYEAREEAIKRLHQEVQALRDLVAAWLEENQETPGDEVVTEVSYVITTTSELTGTAAVTAARRYEINK